MTRRRCVSSASSIGGSGAISRRALVSGAAGFIGSHLCEALLSADWEVHGLDNFLTGTRANLQTLLGRRGFDFEEADVTTRFAVAREVDAVLHFASPASPVSYLRHPVETLKVGTVGTLNLLEVALQKDALFMLASTSEVYGDPLVHPQPETYRGNVNPVGLRSCYDEAKRAGEAFTMAYHRAHRLDTRIVRIFNTHGPRMQLEDGRAVPNFMAQALRGTPLTVYGDGSQTRSLCYVDDLVQGVLRVLESGDAMPYNIGNPEEVSMLELAKTIQRLTGSKSTIEFHPLPEDDPKQRRPDITRARSELGWKPEVGLEAGLERTLAYFRGALVA
jgi:dTDP-glucose 4,6-dehydratase